MQSIYKHSWMCSGRNLYIDLIDTI